MSGKEMFWLLAGMALLALALMVGAALIALASGGAA